MKLTRKEALEITRDLWLWLEKTGSPSKRRWPGWDHVPEMINNCPCCEYVHQKLGLNPGVYGVPCGADVPPPRTGRAKEALAWCPLNKLWPDGCEQLGTAYDNWKDGCFPAARKKNARIIAKAAIQALENERKE